MVTRIAELGSAVGKMSADQRATYIDRAQSDGVRQAGSKGRYVEIRDKALAFLGNDPFSSALKSSPQIHDFWLLQTLANSRDLKQHLQQRMGKK